MESKKLKTTVTESSIVVENMNSEQYNAIFDYTKKDCKLISSSKKNGLISVGPYNKKKAKEIIDFINNGFKKQKTQLEKETIKFKNVTVFKNEKHMEITGLNREEFNLLFDFVKKKSIDFSNAIDKTEIFVYDIESYETVIDFIKQNYNDIDKTFPEKTQLEIDTEKYNLSAEHVEILSKVDYEVVEAKNACDGCVFETTVNECPNNLSDDYLSCVGNNYDIIFKQIHKTQELLNEAIEKEEVEKGIEEPFNVKPPKYNPKDVAFKETKQESKHYKNGLETIQKIKSTLDNLEGEITLFQAFCMGNIIKYEDRAGLKDDKDKDLYKASDYTAMMINNNWIGK